MEGKKKLLGAGVFLGILGAAFLIFTGLRWALSQGVEQKELQILDFYYENACASCREEDKFYAILDQQLARMGQKPEYEVRLHNIFIASERETFKTKLESLSLTKDQLLLPMVAEGERYLCGYDAMEEYLGDFLVQEDRAFQITGKVTSPEEDSRLSSYSSSFPDGEELPYLVFFSTTSCQDCEAVSEFLQGQRLWLETCNIVEQDNSELIYQYFHRFQVPEDEQKVPILFYKGGYLSGIKEIKENLEQILKTGDTGWFEPEREGLDTALSAKKLPYLFLTGLINGLNPCAASMLLMLLAVMAVYKIPVLKTGFSYMAGKYISYVLMGIFVYRMAVFLEQGIFKQITKGITIVLALLAICLCLLNLKDFFHLLKKEYGRITLQLPKGLRKFNHCLINRLKHIPVFLLLPAVFLLGLFLSVGEFFCTGQIYIASILYFMETQRGSLPILAFFLYTLAMCIPQLILVALVAKTKSIDRVSELALNHVPAVKLISAVLFAVLAGLFLIPL